LILLNVHLARLSDIATKWILLLLPIEQAGVVLLREKLCLMRVSYAHNLLLLLVTLAPRLQDGNYSSNPVFEFSCHDITSRATSLAMRTVRYS
jgi:hypothetical protein